MDVIPDIHKVLPNMKVKMLVSCLIKHHATNTYGKVEIKLHAFLTSAQDGGVCSVSRIHVDGINPDEGSPVAVE
jgi:hypothetical protein